jgi:hypothetical protein
MITDYYSKAVKERESKRSNYRTRYTTRQRTIKDYTNNTRNPRQRAATASHDKP